MTSREDGHLDFTLQGSTLIDSRWITAVGVILSNLPQSISLEFVETTENTLTLRGNSANEDVLLGYLNALDNSKKFLDINISSITRIEDGSYNFDLLLTIGDQGNDNS